MTTTPSHTGSVGGGRGPLWLPTWPRLLTVLTVCPDWVAVNLGRALYRLRSEDGGTPRGAGVSFAHARQRTAAWAPVSSNDGIDPGATSAPNERP